MIHKLLAVLLCAVFLAACGQPPEPPAASEAPPAAEPAEVPDTPEPPAEAPAVADDQPGAVREANRDEVLDVVVGEWQLEELVGFEGELTVTPTLVITGEGTVGGLAGVNRYTGAVTPDKETLFGPLAMTMMAGPEPLMKLEQAFGKAMSEVTSWQVAEDSLVLSSAEGPVLRFRKADAEAAATAP